MQKERYIQLLTDYVNAHRQELDDLVPNRPPHKKDPLEYSDYFYDNMSNEATILNTMVKELTALFYDKFLNLDIKINLNGHVKSIDGKKIKEILYDESYISREIIATIEESILLDLLTKYVSIKTNSTEDAFVMLFAVKDRLDLVRSYKCNFCDSHVNLSVDYNKMELFNSCLTNQACVADEYKENNTLQVKLEINSKKLVFFNSPHKIIPIERNNRYKISVNSVLGKIQETELYRLHNIGFFYVGDCCPNIYQKNNKIVLSKIHDESDEYDEWIKEYDYKGYICTDLHWFVVMDYNEFLNYCKNKDVNPKHIEHTVVDIDSNQCIVTSKIVNKDNDKSDSTIAEIHWGVQL